MWRTRAILSLLHEEFAGLPPSEDDTEEFRTENLGRARRRALIVVVLDWMAILALTLFGDRGLPMLSLGPGEHTVFTLAILVVAVHSGFRMGQLEKLRAVARAGERLARRDPDL